MSAAKSRAVALLAAVAVAVSSVAGTAEPAPEIRPGAIEVGLAGALVGLESGTRAVLDVRGTSYVGVPRGILGLGAGCGFTHVAELDRVELLGSVRWEHALGNWGAAGSATAWGGWSEEWLGSFREARYPVGFSLGLRWMPSQTAAIRIDARWLRFLDDPVDDPTERQLLLGLSILFRNAPRPPL